MRREGGLEDDEEKRRGRWRSGAPWRREVEFTAPLLLFA
jgi:hypothetical protein